MPLSKLTHCGPQCCFALIALFDAELACELDLLFVLSYLLFVLQHHLLQLVLQSKFILQRRGLVIFLGCLAR